MYACVTQFKIESIHPAVTHTHSVEQSILKFKHMRAPIVQMILKPKASLDYGNKPQLCE
jgi:hypothetical protein